MKEREVNNFRMTEVIENGTIFLKPLYICIFSRLDLTIVSARNLAAADYNGSSDPYCYVELIDQRTGNPLTKMFTFKTSTISRSLNPCWLESLQWMDIEAPFDRLALRISLYDSDFVGLDTFLGYIQIPFTQLLKECTLAKKRGTKSIIAGGRDSELQPAREEEDAAALSESKYGGEEVGGEGERRGSGGQALLGDAAQNRLERKLLARSASMGNMNKNRKSFSSEHDLPELKPGQVERWFKLQPQPAAEDFVNPSLIDESNTDPRASVTSADIKQQQHQQQHQVHNDDDDHIIVGEEDAKDVFEVAEVTGDIKIRFFVAKAERTAKRPPRFNHKAKVLPSTTSHSTSGGH
jgi:hypothetical protein